MTYKPKPIDTSKVKLPEEIEQLTEILAKNTHENWSIERLREGWVYGPERNDDKKTHSGLIPYEQLSETEKDYDRVTTLETLKAIISLGYTIEKKQ
ncbi:Ryanodine receptor Ryr [Alkalihalophilus pseudofirmus]|nr:Ryanodine receptor Ryr [Alkalihalophilus pseudofirmus]